MNSIVINRLHDIDFLLRSITDHKRFQTKRFHNISQQISISKATQLIRTLSLFPLTSAADLGPNRMQKDRRPEGAHRCHNGHQVSPDGAHHGQLQRGRNDLLLGAGTVQADRPGVGERGQLERRQ